MADEHKDFREELRIWAEYIEELSDNANYVRAFQKAARRAGGQPEMSDYFAEAVTVTLCADAKLLDETGKLVELLRKSEQLIHHYENIHG